MKQYPFAELKVGMQLLTLRSGFGGGEGLRMVIEEHKGLYIILRRSSGYGNKSALYEYDISRNQTNWCQSVYVLTNEDIKIIEGDNGELFRKWQLAKFGKTF